MVAINSLVVTLVTVTCALATPVAEPANVNVEARAPDFHSRLMTRASTPNSSGYHDGYYYMFWADGAGNVNYSNGPGGSYSVNWSGDGNWFGGKGWNPGSARNITYAADYRPSGNSYLSIYGWTTNPIVEYYIIENYGSYNPSSGGSIKGTVYSDGSNYTIYTTTRYGLPSTPGTPTVRLFYSLRQHKRSTGTVTTSNHFDAWKKYGMNLGQHNFQIVATEGYYSSGSSNVTVS